MATSTLTIPVADGEVPVHVAGPDGATEAPELPALLCVPSIFGANDDLLAQMAGVSEVALTAVMDPFWRVEPGAIPYDDHTAAFDRVGKLDRSKVIDDVAAVAGWLAERSNGRVAGLGICFGGPLVLLGTASGLLAGAVAWHGSRMEQFLDRFDPAAVTAPLRFHFGDADPITPPEAIEAISSAFADHPDCKIVVHPGAEHGFSHEGDAWDPSATAASIDSLLEVLTKLRG